MSNPAADGIRWCGLTFTPAANGLLLPAQPAPRYAPPTLCGLPVVVVDGLPPARRLWSREEFDRLSVPSAN